MSACVGSVDLSVGSDASAGSCMAQRFMQVAKVHASIGGEVDVVQVEPALSPSRNVAGVELLANGRALDTVRVAKGMVQRYLAVLMQLTE